MPGTAKGFGWSGPGRCAAASRDDPLSQPQRYSDAAGNTWEPDRYAVGGQMVKRSNAVVGAAIPELFGGERFGNLNYYIAVPPGRYGIRLYMAEQWVGPGMPGGGAAGSRVLDSLCNG